MAQRALEALPLTLAAEKVQHAPPDFLGLQALPYIMHPVLSCIMIQKKKTKNFKSLTTSIMAFKLDLPLKKIQ